MIRLVAVLALAACGGGAVFRLSSDENNSYELGKSLSRRRMPDAYTPVNAAKQPRLFALTAANGPNQKTIIAYDLASGNVMWKTDAEVGSRISVGGDFVVALEGKQLVARDQARGQPRWRVAVPGTFVGATADRDRAYMVWKGSGSTHWLAAYDGGSGKQLWKADAAGELGGPAAQGGLVYVPYLRQWLGIVDGATGKLDTRLRVDQDVTTLRVTSRAAYYGSKQGMFELDARSASGKKAESTYGTVKLPVQLDGTTYGRDVYDPVQAVYTAAERKRVLWTSVPTPTGAMKFAGDGYVVHYFRYLFGFGSDGGLRWAYSHPRVELVASEHTGNVIVALSSSGDLVAIEPQTGAVRVKKSLGTTMPVLGATFDADGWAPSSGESEPIETVAALVSIARDRDARFDKVKDLAVAALARLPGPEVTTGLLGVLADKRAPQKLKDTVVDLLIQRRDPASLPVLTKQLEAGTDYIAGTEPDALGPVAKAIAGLANMPVDPGHVTAALEALQRHLDAATTPVPDLIQVIAAMAAIGKGGERAALASHLLLYHAEDEVGGDVSWANTIVGALAKAGPGERELLRQIATDPRTKPSVADAIRELPDGTL